ncbi:Na+/H+ antiporter subunit E [Deinococcus hohokamensis]|uniref:Na+/H+ antiporter subunit E n=1 Tax=Deinococcus hohokamensis TaxID=309883 RepID=A0ABV9I9F1_9DEIO
MTAGSAVRFWLAQWALLFGCWLLFVSKLDPAESVVGLVMAALAAVIVTGVCRAGLAHFRPSTRMLRGVWHLPGLVLSDTFKVFAVLFGALAGKGMPGRVRAVEFDPGGPDAHSAARRTLAVAALTTSPNSIVIEVDQETLLVHELAPADVSGTLRTLELQ